MILKVCMRAVRGASSVATSSPDGDMLRSFCLEPRVVSGAVASRLRALQPLWHELYEGLARDVHTLSAALEPAARRCAWSSRELDLFKQVRTPYATSPTHASSHA